MTVFPSSTCFLSTGLLGAMDISTRELYHSLPSLLAVVLYCGIQAPVEEDALLGLGSRR